MCTQYIYFSYCDDTVRISKQQLDESVALHVLEVLVGLAGRVLPALGQRRQARVGLDLHDHDEELLVRHAAHARLQVDADLLRVVRLDQPAAGAHAETLRARRLDLHTQQPPAQHSSHRRLT